MARRKKYFNTKSQAIKARELYESQGEYGLHLEDPGRYGHLAGGF